MFFLPTEKLPPLLVLKREDETGTTGNGQEAPYGASQEGLVVKYNTVTSEVVRTTMWRLVRSSARKPCNRKGSRMMFRPRAHLQSVGAPSS